MAQSNGVPSIWTEPLQSLLLPGRIIDGALALTVWWIGVWQSLAFRLMNGVLVPLFQLLIQFTPPTIQQRLAQLSANLSPFINSFKDSKARMEQDVLLTTVFDPDHPLIFRPDDFTSPLINPSIREENQDPLASLLHHCVLRNRTLTLHRYPFSADKNITKADLSECNVSLISLDATWDQFDYRAPICLSSKTSNDRYYLYFANNMTKERWWFNLNRAINNVDDTSHLPTFKSIGERIRHFLVGFASQLFETRWLNLIVERYWSIWASSNDAQRRMCRTLSDALRQIELPNLISELTVTQINFSNGNPVFDRVRVVKSRPDGALEIHIDVKFPGRIRTELKAGFIIDKRRHPDAVLNVNISSLTGTVIMEANPRPSTRVWWRLKAPPTYSLSIQSIPINKHIEDAITITMNCVLASMTNPQSVSFNDDNHTLRRMDSAVPLSALVTPEMVRKFASSPPRILASSLMAKKATSPSSLRRHWPSASDWALATPADWSSSSSLLHSPSRNRK